MSDTEDATRSRRASGARLTKWGVIAFAVIEAALIAWALYSGRIG